jgi:hypothetical protein
MPDMTYLEIGRLDDGAPGFLERVSGFALACGSAKQEPVFGWGVFDQQSIGQE